MTLDSDDDGYYTANDFLTFYYASLPCNSHLNWSSEESTAANIVAIYNLYIEHFESDWQSNDSGGSGMTIAGAPPDEWEFCEEEVGPDPEGLPAIGSEVDHSFDCIFYGDCGLRLVMLIEIGRVPTDEEYVPDIYEAPTNPLCEDEDEGEGPFPFICVGGDCGHLTAPSISSNSPDIFICAGSTGCEITPLEDIVIEQWNGPEELDGEAPAIPCDEPVSMVVTEAPDCPPSGSTQGGSDDGNEDAPLLYASSATPAAGDEDANTPSNSSTKCLDNNGGAGATSEAPVHLASGHKAMSTTDLVVPVTGPDFQLVRHYNSKPASSGVSTFVGNNQWMNIFQQVKVTSGLLTHYGESAHATYKYTWDSGSSKFLSGGPTTRYVTETATEDWEDETTTDVAVYRMVTPGVGTRDFYRDPTGTSYKSVNPLLHGLLREVRDEYGNSQYYVYDIFGSAVSSGEYAAPRLRAIYLNGTPAEGDWEAKIVFGYYLGDPDDASSVSDPTTYHQLHGKLAMLRVFRQESSTEVLTQWVTYTYATDDQAISTHAGTTGDLVQVSRFVSVDDSSAKGDSSVGPVLLPRSIAWRPFITQYRYHSSSAPAGGGGDPESVDGANGQLKSIILPEQIEYAAQRRNRGGSGDAAWNVLRTAIEILGTGDTSFVYSDGIGSTPVRAIDLAAKVIGYETSGDRRVEEQFIQADCGCSGASQGKRIAYDYTEGTASGEDWLTVELTETAWSGTAYTVPYRTVTYDLETLSGTSDPTLYLVTSSITDDAAGAGSREWITHFVYDSSGRVVEKWMPSAVASRTAGTAPSTPPSVTAQGSGVGLVWVYDYNSNNLKTHTYAQEGVRSDGLGKHLTLETVYDTRTAVFYLPTEQRRVRISDETSTSSLAASDIETTTFTYGLSTNTEYPSAIAWIKKAVEAETSSENGPGTVSTYDTYFLFNESGQQEWTRDEADVLTKRQYNSASGRVTSISQNVPNGSFDWTNFGETLSTSGWGESTATPLTTTLDRTLRGQVRSVTRPGGVESYVYREYRSYDLDSRDPRPGIAYFVKTILPHKLASTGSYGADFGGAAAIIVTNNAGRVIGSMQSELDDTATYPPSETAVSTGLEGLLDSERKLGVRRVDHALSGLVLQSTLYETVVPASGGGDQALTTSYAYDTLGRVIRRTDPTGSVTEVDSYDALDRPLAIDSGAMVSGSPSTVRIADYYYDDADGDATPEQGVGEGNLSWIVMHEDGSTTRSVRREYDFRNRLVAITNPDAPHVALEYDNQSRVVAAELYSDDALGGGYFVPSTASRGYRNETLYSQRGLVYRTQQFTDPTQTSPSLLTSDYWYDARGDLIAGRTPSGPVTKVSYDPFGRVSSTYATNQIGSDYDDASSVTADTVVEQVDYRYDSTRGYVDLITSFIRPHDGSGTGALTYSTAVARYLAIGYDDASRPVRRVDFGTNQAEFGVGGTAPTWPPSGGTLPEYDTSGFADTLVAAIEYAPEGRVGLYTDEEGRVTEYQYDDLYRPVVTIENLHDGSVSYSSMLGRFTASGIAQGDIGTAPTYNEIGTDRVTSYYYDGMGRIVRSVSHLGDSSGTESIQSTEYDYSARTTGNALASDINSNAVMSRIRFPLESTGVAVESTDTDVEDFSVEFAYNRLGELISVQDQNGNVHTFSRDAMGRILENAVTQGADVDDLVDSLVFEYDEFGRFWTAASVDTDTSPTVLNQVAVEYDELWRPTDYHQNVLGEVYSSPGTLATTTESVAYAYTTAGGSSSESRLLSVTYPDSSVLQHYYGSSGGLDDQLDRPYFETMTGIHPSGSNVLSLHTYMGVRQPATTDILRPGLTLDRVKTLGGESTTSEYAAFDRFGRLQAQLWTSSFAGFGQGSSSGDGIPSAPAIVAQTQTYDRVSNPLTRFDARTGAAREGWDMAFQYDGLNRLYGVTKGTDANNDGTLASGEYDIGAAEYAFDLLGNWLEFRQDKNLNGSFGTGEIEERTFNLVNELEDRETETGTPPFTLVSGESYQYDKNGNIVSAVVINGNANIVHTYDAWNRLVKVEKESTVNGNTVVTLRGEYEYNALNQQTIRTADPEPNVAGDYEQRRYYYLLGWQLAEEHVDDSYDSGTGFMLERVGQFVYGDGGIDDAVCRRIDANANGNYTDTGDTHWYLLRDIQGSVVAVVDEMGDVYERIHYDPWGRARHGWREDFDGDGDVDATDGAFYTPLVSSYPVLITDSAYNADLDLDMDGDIDGDDESAFSASGYKTALATGFVSDRGGPDNPFGYASYLHRPEMGYYLARHRHYDPVSARWISRDPIGYADGFNLYEYVSSSTTAYVDPSGLQKDDRDPYQVLQDNCDKYTEQTNEKVSNGEVSQEEADCRIGKLCSNLASQDDEDKARLTGLLQGGYDGFVVTTNSAVQTLTFGYMGYTFEELAEGGYLYDPNNPGLASSRAMGVVVGSTLPIGSAATAVARVLRNTVVIGQNMKRVSAFTSLVGGKNFGQALSGARWTPETGPALNAFWVVNHVHDGSRFIDLGSGIVRTMSGYISKYYQMEKEILDSLGIIPVRILWP